MVNQHSQFFFYPFFFTSPESIFIFVFPLDVYPSNNLSFIGLPIVVKISEML